MGIILAPSIGGDRSRAEKILDDLEARTGHTGERLESGARRYRTVASPRAFEPILDKHHRDWRDHLDYG